MSGVFSTPNPDPKPTSDFAPPAANPGITATPMGSALQVSTGFSTPNDPAAEPPTHEAPRVARQKWAVYFGLVLAATIGIASLCILFEFSHGLPTATSLLLINGAEANNGDKISVIPVAPATTRSAEPLTEIYQQNDQKMASFYLPEGPYNVTVSRDGKVVDQWAIDVDANQGIYVLRTSEAIKHAR